MCTLQIITKSLGKAPNTYLNLAHLGRDDNNTWRIHQKSLMVCFWCDDLGLTCLETLSDVRFFRNDVKITRNSNGPKHWFRIKLSPKDNDIECKSSDYHNRKWRIPFNIEDCKVTDSLVIPTMMNPVWLLHRCLWTWFLHHAPWWYVKRMSSQSSV